MGDGSRVANHLRYIKQVEDIVEHQGDSYYVELVLDEFDVEFVEDIPVQHREYFIGRCVALTEEAE